MARKSFTVRWLFKNGRRQRGNLQTALFRSLFLFGNGGSDEATIKRGEFGNAARDSNAMAKLAGAFARRRQETSS